MIRYIINFIRRLFTPTVEKALTGVTKAATKLDKVIDAENATVTRLDAERRALADRRAEIATDVDKAEQRAERASRVRDRLRELVA